MKAYFQTDPTGKLPTIILEAENDMEKSLLKEAQIGRRKVDYLGVSFEQQAEIDVVKGFMKFSVDLKPE